MSARHTIRRKRLALGLGAAAWAGILLLAAGSGAEDDPFQVETARVKGRPIEAFAVKEAGGDRLVVLSIEGHPPHEVRRVTAQAPPGTRESVTTMTAGFEVAHDVVALDVADLDPAPGLEALLISPRAMRIVALRDGSPLREMVNDPPLPLPARTRGLSRLQAIADWEGRGQLGALVPTWDGLVHVTLGDGTRKRLQVPVLSHYETPDPRRPIYNGYTEADLLWPSIGRADDDGDGVLDLFAATRFALEVFHVGPGGLPTRASRKVPFAPFSFEDERRYRSHPLRSYFRDVDGDGRAEVIEHRTAGTLIESHSTTRVFAGGPEGANPSARPAGEIVDDRGFAGVEVFDLDGDGRLEILHNVVPFGILQVARALTTRRVGSELRIFHFPEGPLGEPKKSWQADLAFPLDFSTQRIQGLLPTPEGDWNGDGRRDLIHGDGPETVVIRLGERGEEGPGFGPAIARQALPFSDLALVADVDGDGLDDLITYDTLDREGHVYLALNQANLPGTAPRMGPAAR